MKILLISFYTILFFLCCVPDVNSVPQGKYVMNDEYIIVTESRMFFTIRSNINSEHFIMRNHKYTVETNNKIRFYGMVATDYSIGVGKFLWFLEEEKIKRIDSQTGEVCFFVREYK